MLRKLLVFTGLLLFLSACDIQQDKDPQLEAPDHSINPQVNLTGAENTPTPTLTPVPPTATSDPTQIASADQNTPGVMGTPSATPQRFVRLNFDMLPEAEPGEFQLPIIEGLPGPLAIMRGSSLYLAPFDGTLPIPVGEEVNMNSVSISPDGQKMIAFGRSGFRSYALFTDFLTRTTYQLQRIEGNLGTISWSPDSKWALIVNFEIGLGSNVFLADIPAFIENETPPVVLSNGSFSPPIWLENNKLLHFAVERADSDPNSFDGPPIIGPVRVSVMDPATLEQEPIGEIDPTGNTFDPAPLILSRDDLEVAAYNPHVTSNTGLKNPITGIAYQFNHLPPSEEGVSLCNEWQINRTQDGNPEALTTVYSDTETLLLSDMQIIPESGTLYFLRWYVPECGNNLKLDSLRIDLMVMLHNEDAEILTDGVYPGSSISLNFLRAQNGQKYAVTSNGRYLLWLGGAVSERESTLNLLNTETRENKDLLLERGNSPGTVTVLGYQAILWGNIIR